jgi:hypothetical protein
MAEEIINRVANSGLITIDIAECYPHGERKSYDLAQNLFQGLILKEQDFRQFVKENDWSVYNDCFVAIHCSTDAIIPTWAFMLLTSALAGAKQVYYCSIPEMNKHILLDAVTRYLSTKELSDARVVVKGCADLPIGPEAYVQLQRILQPKVKALMFGEACSTVPIYKKPRV